MVSFPSVRISRKLLLALPIYLAVIAVALGLLFWQPGERLPAAVLQGHDHRVQSVAFSPDGRTLVSGGGTYGRKGELILWDVSSRKMRAALRNLPDAITCVAFSADGLSLAAATYDNAVKLWDSVTGEEVATLLGHRCPASSLAFSRDGRMLLSASFLEQGVFVWNVPSGRKEWSFPGMAPVALSPDGRTIAACGNQYQVKLWDVATRKEICLLAGHTAPLITMTFSPNSRMLATAGFDNTVRLWDVAGRRLRTIFTGHETPVVALAFSAGMTTLASGSLDRTVKLWNLASGEEYYTLLGHLGTAHALAFSPDGRTIASAGSDPAVHIWEVNRYK
jgi:WD40 repeat protein